MRFTATAFRKLLSIYVFSYFPFAFEGRMWDLIVSVPDHCLSFYFSHDAAQTVPNMNGFVNRLLKNWTVPPTFQMPLV